MKQILITGKDSYIGNSFIKYMQGKDGYEITVADTISEEWKSIDFSKFDTVFHVAGIAHLKDTKKNTELFYKINKDLAFEVAKRTKLANVRHFIFLSSISVYGLSSGVITRNTQMNPNTHYGKSKLQAEELIKRLEDDNFNIAIIRPPMIFGKDCKGNFPSLVKLAKKTVIFPYYKNSRSMMYIENFCEFVKLIIDNNSKGIFFPQNKGYFCTSEIIKIIAESQGRKVWMPRIFNPAIWIGKKLSKKMNKVFGDLVIDNNESENIILLNNFESIIKSI